MKNISAIIITLLFTPLFLQAVTEESIRITKFSDTSAQFNEKYDPLRDSPMNIFDGDKKTAGIYSGFSIEFSKPVSIDEIKVINGNAADKTLFKKYGRARDIEITLYALNHQIKKSEDKTPVKKKSKPDKTLKDKTDKKQADEKKSVEQPKENNKNREPDKKIPEKDKPTDEKKKNTPDKEKAAAADTTAGVKPVIGTLNKVLTEEAKPDILRQDEPAAEKKTEEKKTDILSDDNAVETLKLPSKDMLKEIKKDKSPDKKTGNNKKKILKKKKSKASPAAKTGKNVSAKKSEPVKKTDSRKNKVIPGKKDLKEKQAEEIQKKDKPASEKKPAGKTENISNNKKVKESDKVIKETPVKEIPIEPLKKMTGLVRIENDSRGRILVYAALRDTMEQQSIRLKDIYDITRIEFRGRDDEKYKGSESDSTVISEISFFSKGKRIAVEGIDELKKTYIERYRRNLEKSISGEVFSAWDGGNEVTRMRFREDGRIEFRDRYSCKKKGDADCTSTVMPHRWKIQDGRLYMMSGRDWMLWKYELDSAGSVMDDTSVFTSPRWIKLYYRNDRDFSQNYLYFERSKEREWRWNN